MKKTHGDGNSEGFIALHKSLFYATKPILFKIENIWSPFLRRYQLTNSQINILDQLVHVEKISISKLSTSGYMHISAAQNNIKKLCARGLVCSSKVKEDLRITTVQITPEGLLLYEKVKADFSVINKEEQMEIKDEINQLFISLLQILNYFQNKDENEN